MRWGGREAEDNVWRWLQGGTCRSTHTEAVRTLVETCSWSPGGSWPDRDTYCRQQVPQLVAWVLIHAHLLHLKLGKWGGGEITASGPFMFLLERLQRGFFIRLQSTSRECLTCASCTRWGGGNGKTMWGWCVVVGVDHFPTCRRSLRRRSHCSSNVLLTSVGTTHGFDLI